MILFHGRCAVWIRLAAASVSIGLAGLAVPGAASAATPSSAATCSGSLTPDSSGSSSGEPNLLDYTFNCTADITSYTFVVDREPDQTNVIDDFESSPSVTQGDGTTSSTQTFACSGGVPGHGFNCNAPTGTPMTAGNSAQGSLDPIDPYCKRLPPGAAPGTPAEPQAQVSVIVTETSGATDGPFVLGLTSACPSVPDTAPYPPAAKQTPTRKCRGSLAKDSSAANSPDLLDYSFVCDGRVSAYSIVANRAAGPAHTLDAYSATPLVLLPDGAPSGNETFACSGSLPADGFNCLAPSAHPMSGGYTAQGTLDLTAPYCKRLPSGAKAGTPAEPQAVVQLLITDATGAQRGPFTMRLRPACRAVPNQVPSQKRTQSSGRRKRRHTGSPSLA